MTDSGFVGGGSQPGGPYVAFLLGRTATLRRELGLNPVRLRVAIDYTIDASTVRPGWWDARIVGWVYDIIDHAGRPILAFHWHPSRGRVAWPHLHDYGAHESVDLHKLHAPAGTITAAAVARFLIEDLGVLPRRPDWHAILDRQAGV